MKNSTTTTAFLSLLSCISNAVSSETRVGVGGGGFPNILFIPQSGTLQFHHSYNYTQSEKHRTHYIVSNLHEQTLSSLEAGCQFHDGRFRPEYSG